MRFFIYYAAPADAQTPQDFDSQSRVSEFSVSGSDANRADPDSERVILEIDEPQFNHNGGQIAFGPDGFLYIAVGDGGAANDVGLGHTEGLGNGQDKSKLLGKLLRIDVDDGEPFGIPADNPFADQQGARPEIYAFGLRNPFRFSFDRGGDRRLFLGDVGQDLFEEIDIIVAGGNYGWNIKEGNHCFDPTNPGEPPAQCAATGAGGEPLIDPIIEYAHELPEGVAMGISVTGGFVYRGLALPGLVGDYVFGDFGRGFEVGDGSLFAASENADGQWSLRELEVTGKPDGRLGAFLLSLGQDADAELYALTTANVGPTGTTGQVYRLVPGP
ncbi:MAG: PQQ-dependent sugar dehydrogenase [Phycisphaerae bacterium]